MEETAKELTVKELLELVQRQELMYRRRQDIQVASQPFRQLVYLILIKHGNCALNPLLIRNNPHRPLRQHFPRHKVSHMWRQTIYINDIYGEYLKTGDLQETLRNAAGAMDRMFKENPRIFCGSVE